MLYLIGIDDTDNLESRGTGYLSRCMGNFIVEQGLGITGGITRHQLLFDPRVPYTSHNSSACLEVESHKPNEMWDALIQFLLDSCAPGSDCGLCMVEANAVPASVVEWGQTAKVDLVKRSQAIALAQSEGIRLIGLTGTHDGVIGSLAAVGLRASGNDGRFISLKGQDIRSFNGADSFSSLKQRVCVDRAMTIDGIAVSDDSRINLDGWMRPVLKDGQITVLVEKNTDNEEYSYKLADKEHIKSVSD